MRMMLSAYKSFGLVKGAAAVLSGLAVLALMGYIVVDVGLRVFFGESLPASLEISENYLMPLAVFPALAWVYSSGVFPRMDFGDKWIPSGLKTPLVYGLLLVEVILTAVLTYYSFWYAMLSMSQDVSFSASGILFPSWPFHFLVPLGFAVLLVELVFVIINNVLSNSPPRLIIGRAQAVEI